MQGHLDNSDSCCGTGFNGRKLVGVERVGGSGGGRVSLRRCFRFKGVAIQRSQLM